MTVVNGLEVMDEVDPNPAGIEPEEDYGQGAAGDEFANLYSGISVQDGSRSEAMDSEMATKIYDEYMWYKQVRDSVMVPIWNECYRLFRLNYPDERFSYEWRSKINVPYAFKSVKNIVPQLMAGVWEADPLFRIKSDKKPDIAEARERLLKKQVTGMMDLETKWLDYTLQNVIYGTTAGYNGFKALWRNKRSWGKVPNDLNPLQHQLLPRSDVVPEYVGPYFEPIDIYNLFVHPRAEPDAPKKIYWVEPRSLAWMLKSGIYKNLHRLQDVAPSLPNYMSMADYRRTAIGNQNQNTFQYSGDEYQVIMCYDEEQKKVYAMVENGPMIQEDDYPYWHDKCPIVVSRYFRLFKEFYGMGAIEPGISLMHEGNSKRNQRLDNLNLILNTQYEIDDASIIADEDEDFTSRPGGIYFSRGGQAVRVIPVQDVTQSAYIEEKQISADITDITGLVPVMTGQGDSKVNSAAGTSLLQKAGMMMMNSASRQSIRDFKKVLYQADSNNCQFYPLDEIQKVLAPLMFEGWQDSLPEDIMMEMEMEVQPAGTYENMDIKRQQFTNMMNAIASNPIMAQEMDWKEMLKRLLKMFGEHDIPALLVKENTVDILELLFAHQENKMMAAGQQVPPALPSQNKNLHDQVHKILLQQRPDLAPAVGAHEQSHINAELQKQQMMIQGQMAASGGQGGVNPARQPQSSSQEGVIKQAARAGNPNASGGR